MSEDNNDLMKGIQVLIAGILVGFISHDLAFWIFTGALLYYAITGFWILIFEAGPVGTYEAGNADYEARRAETHESAAETSSHYVRSRASAPTPASPTIADRIKSINAKGEFKCPSCGAIVNPTDTKCRFCGSIITESQTNNIPQPAKWSNIEIGQTIRLTHPVDGKLSSPVVQRIYYGELWQGRMTPDTPWTLTGNYFTGLLLKNGMYLLNWQSRYYLLDSHSALTDQDIHRDFASPARQFSASNQTANVTFEYKGTKWRMDDIGRFRIELADGENQKLNPGAIGRFIHASRDNKVLVVEDFQSGGSGSDIARTGYKIQENAVEF